MEEADKRWLMIRIGVSGWMFLLVLDHPGSPRQWDVKQLLLLQTWQSVHFNDVHFLHESVSAVFFFHLFQNKTRKDKWHMNLCGLDVPSFIQSRVLKHWQKHKAITPTSGTDSSFLNPPPGGRQKEHFFLMPLTARHNIKSRQAQNLVWEW